jgi:magnesium transporter
MAEQDFTELEQGVLHDEDDELDEDNLLKPRFVDSVAAALEQGDEARAYELVEPLHPADIADLFELLERDAAPQARRRDHRPADRRGHRRAQRLRPRGHDGGAAPGRVADIAEQLDTDDAVQLIEDLEPRTRRRFSPRWSPRTARRSKSRWPIPRRPPGRLMQRELVAVPEHLTVGDLIDYLRDNDGPLPTEFWEVFVVDPTHKPVGTCQLSAGSCAPRGTSRSVDGDGSATRR